MLHEVDLQASRCISLECEVDLLFAFDGHIGQHLRVEPLHGGDEKLPHMVRPQTMLLDAAKHASDGHAL